MITQLQLNGPGRGGTDARLGTELINVVTVAVGQLDEERLPFITRSIFLACAANNQMCSVQASVFGRIVFE
jgi:hypothetical protein